MAGRWHLVVLHPLPDEHRLEAPLKDLGAFSGDWALDLRIGPSRVALDAAIAARRGAGAPLTVERTG